MGDMLQHLFVIDVKPRLIKNTPYEVYRMAGLLGSDETEVIDLRFTALDEVPESEHVYLFLETAGTWMCFDWNPSRFRERMQYLSPRCRSLTLIGPQAPAVRELLGSDFRVVDTLDFSCLVPGERDAARLTDRRWLGVDRNKPYNGQFFDGTRMWLAPTFSVYRSMSCPLTCGFCYYAAAPRQAQIDFAALIADVEWIHGLGHSHFFFMDPNFVLNARRYALLEQLHRETAGRFSYFCQVSPNFLDAEHAARLAATGCRGMVIGIENREQIAAKGDIAEARGRIDHLKTLGMMPTLYFMIDGRNEIVDLVEAFEDVPFQYTVLNRAFAGDRSLGSIVDGFAERRRLASDSAGLIERLRARPNYIGASAALPDVPGSDTFHAHV